MIKLKSKTEIEILRESGRRLAGILADLEKQVKPGVTTAELDALAQQAIKNLGDQPAFLNYKPKGHSRAYPAALCTSVNEEVVHGIPNDLPLKEGDIVTLDLGLIHQGLYTDSAITVPVGKVSVEAELLLEGTKAAMLEGIKAIKVGGRIGDIGYAIEQFVKPLGYGIVRDLAGHGVGYGVHEDPYVPNYGLKNTGEKIEAGLVIAIEPMLTLGTEETEVLDDGYTVVTADGSLAAHFEHTVAVTEDGADILTKI
jgi:methionyl aminopeptidase